MASSSVSLAGSVAASNLLRSSIVGFIGLPLRSLGSA
ncbi:hypothetical protein L195_g038876, partial [Trifolium pratense]